MVQQARESPAQILLSLEKPLLAFKMLLTVLLEQPISVKCALLCTQTSTPTFTWG